MASWRKAGSYVIPGVQSYALDRDGRARDNRTGHFVSKRGLARRKGKSITLSIFRGTNPLTDGGTEVTYKVSIPKNIPPERREEMVEAAYRAMKKDGVHGTKTKNPTSKVRFFTYLEGEAVDLKSGKRIRGGTRLGRTDTPNEARKAARSKVRGLLEGASLSNDPFKTIDSGSQGMKRGPDTFFLTALYGPTAKVPKFGKRE